MSYCVALRKSCYLPSTINPKTLITHPNTYTACQVGAYPLLTVACLAPMFSVPRRCYISIFPDRNFSKKGAVSKKCSFFHTYLLILRYFLPSSATSIDDTNEVQTKHAIDLETFISVMATTKANNLFGSWQVAQACSRE